MKTTGKETGQALTDRLEAQIERVNEAIAKIRRNELTDISDMDKEISMICAAVMNAREDVAATFEPRLAVLINILDEFAAELKDYQERVKPDGKF